MDVAGEFFVESNSQNPRAVSRLQPVLLWVIRTKPGDWLKTKANLEASSGVRKFSVSSEGSEVVLFVQTTEVTRFEFSSKTPAEFKDSSICITRSPGTST